jgi:hypothetical protein
MIFMVSLLVFVTDHRLGIAPLSWPSGSLHRTSSDAEEIDLCRP